MMGKIIKLLLLILIGVGIAKIELTFRKASSGKFNTNIKAKYMYI